MLISSIMSAPAITVDPSASLLEAAGLMLDHNIGGLPVVDSRSRLVGIVTESDFLRRSELGTEKKRSAWLSFFVGPGRAADEYVHSHGRKVEEVMSWPVRTISPSADAAEAAALMEQHDIKRLPVVVDEMVVGIVSRRDFVIALARQAARAAAAHADDAHIEEGIIGEIASQRWSGNTSIRVSVKNGIAELSGAIFDDRERRAARVAAENAPGVKEVVDCMVWIEPNSGMLMP